MGGAVVARRSLGRHEDTKLDQEAAVPRVVVVGPVLDQDEARSLGHGQHPDAFPELVGDGGAEDGVVEGLRVVDVADVELQHDDLARACGARCPWVARRRGRRGRLGDAHLYEARAWGLGRRGARGTGLVAVWLDEPHANRHDRTNPVSTASLSMQMV